MAGNGRTENKNIVGAAMVVGGGIAGMQASLDLADAGYKVYLVEKKSAIGGHMAQLDKTFPTNDCAMCTISPKLVEVGRHRNIELLTNSEVLDLKGEAGNFTVRVQRNPRFIDPLKCTACGDCAKVCPVVLPDFFNEGLSERRAAHKLYPQATPNAFAIEKRGIAPCRDACPAGQRAQGYIALIREGRYDDALRVIKEDNPFPGICGRICNHRCETACNRGKLDEPLNIHALKRFVADWVYNRPRTPPSSPSASHSPSVSPPMGGIKGGLSALEPSEGRKAEQKYRERVAIIGAGPCGLTAAQDLCKLGYGVTVFEALPVAGGMLRVGVPEFRLPGWIVDREVQDIVDLGVELRLNTRVDNLDEIFEQGFNSVLIAVGAHEGVKLPIAGADLAGVMVNTHFLRDVRLGEPPDFSGRRVMVLGGGNVAIDVARSAVRLGAAEVHLACLEERATMPAHAWEIEEAEAEGVILHPGRSFKRILDGGRGQVAGLECLNVTFMEFDELGRLTLETEPGSEHVIPCDVVIFSIGQRAGLAFIPESSGVGVTRRATIAINPNTLAATRPGVFAAGDATTGAAFVIEAVASGHRAAQSIHRYLRGEELEPPPKPELPVAQLTQAEIEARMQRGEVRRKQRTPMPMTPVEERRRTFSEVEKGYTEAQAREEAARCLACGVCSECLCCVYACQAGAINHDQAPTIEEINVGAIVLAPGYQLYQAELSEEYGWGRYPNVVTSLQFERLLSASGPTQGHVLRPSDGQPARKIAFLQCIGSRDQSHDYCSAVCCMYAAKEAVMARQHDPEAEITIFFMDMRAFSKGYEGYYRRAQEQYGINYVRCRVSSIKEDPHTRNLIVRYVAGEGDGGMGVGDWEADSDQKSKIQNRKYPKGTQSKIVEEPFEMVVLSVGMEMAPAVRDLGRRMGIELDDYGFCHTIQFQPLQTSKPGIYAVGPFREPKDIPETVIEASGAAALAGGLLAPARGALITPAAYPPERDVGGEEPRIGVFVCHCGSNIGGFLDVPAVTEYARTLPGVAHAEDNLYTCSQDSIRRIIEKTQELALNRVVVASCTPLTHGPIFQDTIRQAGLNPYLFEMANIRNQCSWVHSDDHQVATEKAKELVRMAVARAARLEALHRIEAPVTKRALVIGGGVAGMRSALALAGQGIPVNLVEREAELGGNLRRVHFLVEPPGSVTSVAGGGERDRNLVQPGPLHLCPPAQLQWHDARVYLQNLIKQVETEPHITIHLETELVETHGYKGNFTSRLHTPTGEILIQHGATIVATGAQEYRGPEYGYGSHPRIITQQEFETLLAGESGSTGAEEQRRTHSGTGRGAGEQSLDSIPSKAHHQGQEGEQNRKSKIPKGHAVENLKSVVMIQCVGPAEKYCSRTCCAIALKNALKLKELNPAAQITILYRDIRTYGFKERLYTEARRAGVVFIRYDAGRKPEILTDLDSEDKSKIENRKSEIEIRVWEPILQKPIVLRPDYLVLSMPMTPATGVQDLANRLKVSVDLDNWLMEAHMKLRPVDFSTEGLYMAGAAHYPKLLDETIAQAQAAAARAATILTRDALSVGGVVAQVNPQMCVGCLTCVRICPFNVPEMRFNITGVGEIKGAAYIEPARCQGCGICAAECPAQAIQLMHYRDAQMEAKIEALFEI
jgi:heterodisulfide reductase subunit A-like polyferredoxin